MIEPTGQHDSGPVTIAHIAETAGVSVPTVSKVPNGRSGVSKQTRARIEGLIEHYGYRKPPAKDNKLLELVFHDLAGLRAVEIIRGVEQVAREHRLGVVISESGPDQAGTFVDDLMGRRPRAVLAVAGLSEPERDLFKARGIPFLVLDPTSDLSADVPFIGATDWRGGQMATRHLIELGHRRIAVISEPDHLLPCRARLAGFHSAMQVAASSHRTRVGGRRPAHSRRRCSTTCRSGRGWSRR